MDQNQQPRVYAVRRLYINGNNPNRKDGLELVAHFVSEAFIQEQTIVYKPNGAQQLVFKVSFDPKNIPQLRDGFYVEEGCKTTRVFKNYQVCRKLADDLNDKMHQVISANDLDFKLVECLIYADSLEEFCVKNALNFRPLLKVKNPDLNR